MLDRTAQRAMSLLTHPSVFAALALLLVNDHLLRRLWPSWLTGKLGDFAWLYGAPLALAAALTLVLPRGLSGRGRWAGGLAFGAVGGIFALAKTWPAFHALAVNGAEMVFRFPVGWRRDPTDLVALAALAAAWRLWVRGQVGGYRRVSAGEPRLARPAAAGWVVLPLAALLTMANGPMPEPGVFCLSLGDGSIQAFSGRGSFTSPDGGLSWQETAEMRHPDACSSPWSSPSEPLLVTDPRNTDLRYRAVPDLRIELSEDGGMAWHEAYRIRATGELEAAKLNRQGTLANRESMPKDGLVDPATGNAVFAMGHLGVLVHTPGRDWLMVPVGDFRPLGEEGVEALLGLLIGETLLALAVGLLALVTLAGRFAGPGFWGVLRAIGWVVWGVCVLVFPPALAEGYGVALSYLAMLAAGIVILPCVVRSAVGLAAVGPRIVPRLLAVAGAVAALFLLPYVLWGTAALPHYWLAVVFALLSAAAALAAGRSWVAQAMADAGGEKAQVDRVGRR